MKKRIAFSLFFAAFFAATLSSCNGPLDGDYRTIHLNGFGEANGSNDLESANTPPPVVNTEYIIKELESKLAELIQALDGKADGEPVSSKLEVDGTTCTVTLRKNGEGYDVEMDKVDLTNEHALKSLLCGMQNGIPDSKPIYLDFSDCKGSYMPSIIGRPEVDKDRFVSVILPDTVTNLSHAKVVGGDDVRTFEGFSNLKKIVARGVTQINEKAFEGLENLEEVNIPLARNIGALAFEDCIRLTTLVVDNESITAIENNTFHNCTSLTSIDFPNVATIGNYAFQGCSNLISTASEPLGLDPQKITSIGSYAFQNCTSLEEVYFPKIPSVPSNAFNGCTNLESLKDDWGLATTIGRSAFYNCGNLVTVKFTALRNSGTNIVDRDAFAGCSSLDLAYMPTIDRASINSSGNSSLTDALDRVAALP